MANAFPFHLAPNGLDLPLDLKISQNGCFAFAETATLVCDLVVVVIVVVVIVIVVANTSNNLLADFLASPQVLSSMCLCSF